MTKLYLLQAAALLLIITGSINYISRSLLLRNQVAAVAGSNSLISHWTFDEGGGDSVGGNTLSLYGPVVTSGKLGSALSFDGMDDVANAGTPTSLADLGPMSVSLWVNPSGTIIGENFLVSKINTTATGWRLSYSCCTNNNIYFRVDYDGTDLVKTTTSISSNAWHHIVLTWDGSTSASGVRIFVDGSEAVYHVSTDGSGSRISDGGRNFNIGNITQLTRPFGGLLDDVRVYNYVLSATEVLNIFTQAGGIVNPIQPTTPTGPTTPPPTNPTPASIPPSLSSSPAPMRTVSYTSPIGIPEPDFGIREDVTMYLQSGMTYDFGTGPISYPLNAIGEPYTHYIEASHPNATDSNNPFGSPSTPRKTIPLILTAGSVVELHGSMSPITGVTVQGTKSKPVFIRGQSQSGRGQIVSPPEVVKTEFKKGSQYVILENILFKGSGIHIRQNTHHVVMRYSEVTGQPAIQDGRARSINSLAADSAWVAGEHIENILFYKNTIHDNGSELGWPAVCDCGMQAIAIGDSSYKVWVIDNEIYRNNEDGIHVIDFNKRGAPTFIYIGRNRIYDNGENAVDIKQAQDIIVSQNKMYHYRPTIYSGGSDGSAVVINNEAARSSVRTWIIFNEIYDSTVGLRSQGDQEYYIIGNVFYDIRKSNSVGGYVMYVTTSPFFHIVGNTLYNFDNGIIIQNGGVYEILNNLISSSIPIGSYHLGLNRTLTIQFDLKNNLVYSPSGAVIRNLPTYPCVNCILNSDPLLNGHVLSANSPAINKGVPASVYDTFLNLYGIDIKKDIIETGRPQSSVWDIGAYEYSGTITQLPTTFASGDFNKDGSVNAIDYSLLASAWNSSNSTYDLNKDGRVNTLDYSIMVRNWTT